MGTLQTIDQQAIDKANTYLKKTAAYTHWSQVSQENVKPGTFSPDFAGKIAEAIGLEAFQYSEDSEWYALDDEGRTTLRISLKLAVSMDAFRF